MRKNKLIYLISIVVLFSMLLCSCGGYKPYDYDIAKYLTLGEYKGLKCDYANIGVTDADLQQAIHAQLRENGYGEPKEVATGSVLFGDIVTLDFSGSINGKTDDALGATNYELEIGTGTFLDAFEQGLIGHEIGKSFKLDIEFPVDYIKIAYAGKTVSYDVTITKASRMVFPELTDDIVSKISEQNTVDEYMSAKRTELEKASLQQGDADREQALWQQVLDASEVVEYPEDAIEHLTKTYQEQFEKKAAAAEMKMSEYLEQNNLTWDEIKAYVNNNVKATCKEEMVMYLIARSEGLEVSTQEIDALAKEYADTYGYVTTKELYEDYSKEFIKQTILSQKVKDFVVENASE